MYLEKIVRNTAVRLIAKGVLKKLFPEFYESLSRKVQYNTLNLPKIPCHLYGLFIRHDGNVYPCCNCWSSEYLKIGHINDPNLFNLVRSYDKCCYCQVFKLRKALPTDKVNYEFLNIEVSLACQGKCAMCCVESPTWHGKYDYYNELTKLIDYTKPKKVVVQGGEVLIQKRTLEWVSDVRKNYPDIEMCLVTNGNVEIKMVDMVEELFGRVTISIVGFESETYKKIMGLEFNKTIQFAEELVKRKRIKVFLKYLVTPINAHEANLFLDWAIRLNSNGVMFNGASNYKYINLDAPYEYWQKIFERTSQALKLSIIQNKNVILENNMMIAFDGETKILFGIDDYFIERNGLGENIKSPFFPWLFYPESTIFENIWT